MMAKGNTICWNCAKACRKCPWSRNFEPVDGWNATPTKVYSAEGVFIDSFIVHECPLFEEEINESLSRVSAKWLAEKFGGISARSVNRMPIDKLFKKCAEHELDIEIKWYKGDRRYYLKTNKKSFIYLPKALIEQFFGVTGNGQF